LLLKNRCLRQNFGLQQIATQGVRGGPQPAARRFDTGSKGCAHDFFDLLPRVCIMLVPALALHVI
jgi:hypothetical protein